MKERKMRKVIAIPLSLCVLATYAIKRGFTIFAKSDNIIVPGFHEAMATYFLFCGLVKGFLGIVTDNVSSRKLFVAAAILGTAGILLLGHGGPWGFGLCFGAAATFMKLCSFSAPMKLGGNAKTIVPLSMAKNAGALFFLFIFGSAIIGWEWPTARFILMALFAGSAMLAYFWVPDDKIPGWKLDIFWDWVKNWKWWTLITYETVNVVFYYLIWASFWPLLISMGYSKTASLGLLAVVPGVGFVLRYPFAWLGDRVGHWKVIAVIFSVKVATFFLMSTAPLLWLWIFAIQGAGKTPNYWPLVRSISGPKYVATIAGIATSIAYVILKFVL